MSKKLFALMLSLLLSLSCISCLAEAAPQLEPQHSEVALAMQSYLEEDPELMTLMEKSIAQAHEINPDPNTNPVDNIDELYDFIDWMVTCMPWNVLTDVEYPTLYNHIDQSIDYIWFLLDQPLEELEGKGYYYPTLQYHEPIASWCKEYSDEWGAFLSTEESWNDIYYQRIKDDPSMNMQYGWYADTNVWHTFNEWFSRYLIDPSVRLIADSAVVSPADSTPQGIWDIDENGDLVQKEGVAIKSANFTSVAQLIGPDSDYAGAFNGGTLTHTFLDVNDYHRYHFPVSGTIKEVRKIPAINGAGGITEWDPETQRYVLLDAIPGWQMIETRDCVIIDTGDYGLVAVLPIGMSQICSCNWEDTVQVGAKVEKGDPMGYFLFGGSDIVMVFQAGVDVDFLCEADESGYKHILMGEAYADLEIKGAESTEFASGKKIYFAAPLFSQSEKDYNLQLTHLLEDHGYEVFLPQRDGYLAAELEGKTEEELTELIFQKDLSEVLKADIIFMVLDGRVPDEGACVELGIAYANGKRCYGVKTDARSVEIKMDLNPMITGCFLKLFKNSDGDALVEELEQYLAENEL